MHKGQPFLNITRSGPISASWIQYAKGLPEYGIQMTRFADAIESKAYIGAYRVRQILHSSVSLSYCSAELGPALRQIGSKMV